MSIAFPRQRPTPPSTSSPLAGETPGRYLTDGVRLFRCMGPIGTTPGMTGLENCSSLDVVAVRPETLRGLRPVVADAARA